MALWRRYWWSLALVHLVAHTVPGLVAVLGGAGTGLFPNRIPAALRAVLLDQDVGGLPDWAEVYTAPGGVPAFLLFLLLTLVTSAGKLGVLRAIVHGGRRPEFPDFVNGIRLYSARLLVVKLLSLLVLGVTALVALLVMLVAGVILSDWLLPIVALAVMLAGLSAVLYAEIILVVEEDSSAWEAMGDSVGVLTGRWQEALGAIIIFLLVTGIGELGTWLFTRVEGPVGLLLGLLPGALVGGFALIYLTLRYIENVYRGLYAREGSFALERKDAG